ncbi:ATP-binding cassette domain-containing protein [Streptococcus sp. CSL10205-OR2]|uniref:ATP-binding cassette domain-containing protein n=1 Tax=Streptococcus sp. CSL10205-OR2 TaxID=2980558 RepID=UPI0021DB3E59|nr:ATP-binding cassette domain-containing protein [Streptococcus sp. CSL10205-OR2]MCU9533074.1 ATP-binding cassette domain-containing protein [Streptococcus sp. CSL10205-OR2]
MLLVENLSYAYQDHSPLFEGLHFSINSGEKILIGGYSGCGKSSLAFLLAGLKKPTSGQVLLDDKAISPKDVGFIFQNPDLQFCMDTVALELLFVLENLQENPETMAEKVTQVLQKVGLANYHDRQINTLSQGEKQRLSLAAIFLKNPKVMILDEAFANLDKKSALKLLGDVLAYQEQTNAILIVIDHLIDYYEGKMTTYYWFEKGLSAVNYDVLKQYFPPLLLKDKKIALGDTLLETKQFQVQLAKDKTIFYPDITLKRGERLCLDGPSGIGKSSFFLGLLGIYKNKGAVKGIKKDMSAITFLFQNPLEQFIFANVYEEIYQTCQDEKKTQSILETLQLWEKKDLSPFQLSQGQQRRLAVGIILASQASLVLIDEPTYGQDAYHAQAIMDLILNYCQENHCGLIFTSHDQALKETLATRFVEVTNAIP